MDDLGDRADRPSQGSLAEARTGLFRATLLFGSIAVALALIVAPAAERGAKYAVSGAPQLDPIATGSIRSGEAGSYTIRRSVLQPAGAAPCIVFSGGGRSGAC